MIAALLKRDPARGAVVRWMFFSVIGSTALLNIIGVLRALTDVGANHLAAVARVMAIVIVGVSASRRLFWNDIRLLSGSNVIRIAS